MDYLFFDIEASEGKSICSFGYVLTDDELNIKEKNDILINPKSVFCTSARGKNKKDEKEKGITLAYSVETFLASPIFPEVYSKIKNLIERENTLIIGFAHTNDVRYLHTACTRYSLPYFNYRFFDIQDVFRMERNETNQVALEKIINDAHLDISSFTLHKSVDDAEISMLAAKHLCEKYKCKFSDIIKKYSLFLGEVRDGTATYNGVDKIRSAERKARCICRTAVIGYAKSLKINGEAKTFVSGHKFCAGSRFEKEEWLFALKLISFLAENGGQYVSSVTDADYFIKFYADEGTTPDRLYYALQNKNLNIKIIDADNLLEESGTSRDKITAYENRRIQRISKRLNAMLSDVEKEREQLILN